MKNVSSFYELIFIVLFMMAGVAGLRGLMYTTSTSVFDTISDKTLYNVGDAELYDEFTLSGYDVLILPYIQDDTCPKDYGELGVIVTNVDVTRNELVDTDYEYTVDNYTDASTLYSYNITTGWAFKNIETFRSLYNKMATGGLTTGQKYALVWNYEKQAWFCTKR